MFDKAPLKIPDLTGELKESLALTLPLTHYQWHCAIKPATLFTIYALEDGLHVLFNVKEQKPKCLCTENFQRVCEDSAVELFLAFPQTKLSPDIDYHPTLEQDLYFNFEFNSAGICYAKYAPTRKNRTPLTEAEIKKLDIKTKLYEDSWRLRFIVPRDLIKEKVGYDPFEPNCLFALNAYKISEDPKIEHYVSLSEVKVPTPNFHRPDFFVRAYVYHDSPLS